MGAQMRTSIDHKVYFHDLDQPEIMVPWGNSTRRRRLKPETLLVEWRKEIDGDDWVLWEVYLMGRYVHAQSQTSIAHHCYQFRRTHEALWSIETPDWVHELVERARPIQIPATEIFINGEKQGPSPGTLVGSDQVSRWIG